MESPQKSAQNEVNDDVAVTGTIEDAAQQAPPTGQEAPRDDVERPEGAD